MFEAGDWEVLSLDRSRLLYLLGIGFSIEGHTKGNLDLVKVVEGDCA